MKQSVHSTSVICVLTTLLLLANTLLLAQAPQKMSYQAVIRDAEGELIRNSNIGMQVSILQGSADGMAVFVERHFPTTNENGLVSIEIGDGTQLTGSMEEIDWTEGPYFIKTEIDLQGGASYTIAGVSQVLSVPYALHAKTAETVTEGIEETDPWFTAWDKSEGISITESQISDLGEYLEEEVDPLFTASPASGIQSEDILNWDTSHSWGDHADAGYISEETQTLADVAALDNSVNTQIKDLMDPTDPQDAATKAYVDLLASYVDSLLERIEALENELFAPAVTDIDGNVYQTVIIGDQLWMAENLRVTRDASGNSITRYCYDNDGTNCELYGGLYTWNTVMNGESSSSGNPSGVQGICPDGWHVPSDAEWTELVNYVVSQGYPNNWNDPNGAGNALKSCRQVDSPLGGNCDTSEHPRWEEHDTHHGYDAFDFSALPGGDRWSDGSFDRLGARGYWWSSTEYSSASTWYRSMGNSNGSVNRAYSSKNYGFSLRCVRNN